VGLKATVAWFADEQKRERERGNLRAPSSLAKAAAV